MNSRQTNKALSRQRILDSAGTVFRRKGFEAARVDEIMEGAGLTHGAFYVHFASKRALFAEVMAGGHVLIDALAARGNASPADLEREAMALFDRFLGPDMIRPIARLCSLAALGAEAGRAGGEAAAGASASFHQLADELARGLRSPGKDDDRALAAAALWVGAVAMSGVCETQGERETLGAAARAWIARMLAAPEPA